MIAAKKDEAFMRCRMMALASLAWCQTVSAFGQTTIPTHAAIIVGQSIADNFNAIERYKVRHAANVTLDWRTGRIAPTVEPMLGPEVKGNEAHGSFAAELGDLLCDDGRCVVTVNGAYGGTFASHWAPGGILNDRITAISKAVLKAGLKPAFIEWNQGESERDCAMTPTTQNDFTEEAYKAELKAIRQTFVNNGIDVPFVVTVETWGAGGLGACSTRVEAAQKAIVDNVKFFPGPNLDVLGNEYRRDGTHFNAKGDHIVAGMIKPFVEKFIPGP